MSRDGGRGYGKTPNYVTQPAPAFRFKVPGGTKATACYSEVVKAWRAGVVEDFYYGTRSDTDSTLIWIVDGVEYGAKDFSGVLERVAKLAQCCGVVSIEFGETWCGYRALVVTFAGGIVVTQRYDGCRVVEAAERVA